MKKFFGKVLPILMIVLLLAFVFVLPALAQGETPPANEPPKIEQFDFLAQLLIGIITLAVTFGLKSLASEWGIDITGKGTQITATIVGAVFEGINQLIALTPPTYYPVVAAGFGLLTAVLIAFGASYALKKYLPVVVDPKSKTLPIPPKKE